MRYLLLALAVLLTACADPTAADSPAPESTAPARRSTPGIRFRERVDSSGLSLNASDFSATARLDSVFVAGRYITPNRGDTYVLRPEWRSDTLALRFTRIPCVPGTGEICVLVPTVTTMSWDVVLSGVAGGSVPVVVQHDSYMLEPTGVYSLGVLAVPGR